MSIIQVSETRLFTLVIVTTKDNKRCTSKGCRVPSSWSRWYTFDLRKRPKPFAFNCIKKKHGYKIFPQHINKQTSLVHFIFKRLYVSYLLRPARHPSVVKRIASDSATSDFVASATSASTDCTASTAVTRPFSNFFSSN